MCVFWFSVQVKGSYYEISWKSRKNMDVCLKRCGRTLMECSPKALYYHHKIEVSYTQGHLLSSCWLTCELMTDVPWMFTWWQRNHYFVSGRGNVLKQAQCNLANQPLSCWLRGIKDTASDPHILLGSKSLSEWGLWSIDLVLWNKSSLFKCQYLIRPLHWSMLVFPLL